MTHFKGGSLEAIQSAFVAAFNRSIVLATAGCWVAVFSTFFGCPITWKGVKRQNIVEQIAIMRATVDRLQNETQLRIDGQISI